MGAEKQIETFHSFLIKSAEKTNASAVIIAFVKYKKGDVQPDEVTNTWLLRFKWYLEERNLSANTTSKYIKVLTAILKRAKSRGYVMPIEFEDVRVELIVKSEASESTYLNRDELKLLEDYIPSTKGETFTRAIFLLCAYTGCRISDAEILTVDNFSSGELNYTSDKTKATSRLPLHPLVPELIAQVKKFNYDIETIRVIVGRDIKTICRKLGIITPVTLYRRGERMTKPKWAMISSHTARKSFATNMLLDGYTIEQISRILGHGNGKGDPAMTMGYICTSYTDTIVGDKTYLRPNLDALYDKLMQMIDVGLNIEQACSSLAITGTSQSEIERVKNKFNTKTT